MGFTANVSARALKVAGTSFAVFFHHEGIRPQRIGTKSTWPPRSITTSIVSVGQILWRGGELCSGAAGTATRGRATISRPRSRLVDRPHTFQKSRHWGAGPQ